MFDSYVVYVLMTFAASYVIICCLSISVKRNEKRLAIATTTNAVTPLVWDDIVSKIPIL